MGINKIGNRRYNYMIVAFELGNSEGTLGLRSELGYIRRCHFSKPKMFASICDSLQGIQEQYFVVLSV